MLGKGFLEGTQNQFNFIGEQSTDFPFPVFAEEWGLVGCLVLLLLYAFLTVWGIRVASQARTHLAHTHFACGTLATHSSHTPHPAFCSHTPVRHTRHTHTHTLSLSLSLSLSAHRG